MKQVLHKTKFIKAASEMAVQIHSFNLFIQDGDHDYTLCKH